MKIAATFENGQIFAHFGHTQQFKIYEVQDGKILSSAVVDTNGSGHGALAGFLKQAGVNALICGGIGQGAKNALTQAGIILYAGVAGSADEAVQKLLAGNLSYNSDITCAHHGNHGCGGHHDEGSCSHHGHNCAHHEE